MALSKEEKEALAEHFHGRDVYDPSKDPAQEVTTFAPKMNCGGEMGYAEGGEIDPGLQDAINSASADDVLAPQGDGLKDSLVSVPNQPAGQPAQAVAAAPAPPAPPSGGKLSPDEFQALIAGLSKGPGLGQSAMSGIAGLADAIESGVARAPGPGFQRNIMEGQKNQRDELVNALKAKYETQFRGKELEQGGARLSEEARANLAREKEAADRLKEETRQHGVESGLKAKEIALQTGKEAREAGQVAAKNQVEAAQKIVEAYEKAGISGRIGLAAAPTAAEYETAKKVLAGGGSAPATGPIVVKTREQWAVLPKGTPYVDSKGKPGIKQ